MASVLTDRRRRRPVVTPLRLAIGLLTLSALAAVAGWVLATGWAPARARYPVQGVAVSAANGPIDWPTVHAKGADFAYIRASAGSDLRDPAFAGNWASARETGLRYGALHEFSLCRLASDQARQFLSTVPRDNAALPPVVALGFGADCKARPGRDVLLSELATFLNEIEAHGGKPAILRLSPEIEAAYRLSDGLNRTLWLDRDVLVPAYAARPWVLWTANRWRRMSGIAGPVDWTVVRP